MRLAIITAAIAVLALPVAAQEGGKAPAQAACKAGKLVELTVLVVEPGLITFHIPPTVCEQQLQRKAPSSRPAASSPTVRGI